ncbi:MAG: endonuclease domain-containing protein [Nitrospira sp.]|nr:endonuclease domain-containing protein [Nitrospira sp.]MDE0485748.1 endonuclease domain-containing protein [Nitrospira sp.]
MNKPAKAQELRQHSTDAEQALWKHLRNRQLAGYKFRRQVLIGKYIADFVCFERKIVIEVDGGHHQEQALYDTDRTTWLESQGFQVLRFWNHEILAEAEAVQEALLVALQQSSPSPDSPSPQPSPVKGEGEKRLPFSRQR